MYTETGSSDRSLSSPLPVLLTSGFLVTATAMSPFTAPSPLHYPAAPPGLCGWMSLICTCAQSLAWNWGFTGVLVDGVPAVTLHSLQKALEAEAWHGQVLKAVSCHLQISWPPPRSGDDLSKCTNANTEKGNYRRDWHTTTL